MDLFEFAFAEMYLDVVVLASSRRLNKRACSQNISSRCGRHLCITSRYLKHRRLQASHKRYQTRLLSLRYPLRQLWTNMKHRYCQERVSSRRVGFDCAFFVSRICGSTKTLPLCAASVCVSKFAGDSYMRALTSVLSCLSSQKGKVVAMGLRGPGHDETCPSHRTDGSMSLRPHQGLFSTL